MKQTKTFVLSGRKRSFLSSAALLLAVLLSVSFLLAGCGDVDEPDASSAPISSETVSQPASSEPEGGDPIGSEPVSEPVSSEPVSSETTPSPSSTAPKPPVSSSGGGSTTGTPSDFAAAQKINSEVVARLVLPGTKLDYYIPKTTNNDFYIDHALDKSKSSWGNPYLDYRCTLTKSSSSHNLIIYGHSNDSNGTQLSALKSYQKVDFYKKNPTIRLDTPSGSDTYKIIAFFIENTAADRSYFRYNMFIDQTDKDSVDNFIASAKKRSYINTTVDYTTSDQFLTISTCQDTNLKNFNRLVLVARKVRAGESASVDTSKATQNTAQVLPKK